MAVTRLERKGKKNKNVAKNRINAMKRLSFIPVIKNVDIEAIKAEFIAKVDKKEATSSKGKTKSVKTPEKKVTTKAGKKEDEG